MWQRAPLRWSALCPAELDRHFRFSSLSRLRQPVPRVASAFPAMAQNAITGKASSACRDYTAACAFLLNKVLFVWFADWICVSFVFSECRVFVMAVIQFNSLFFPFFFYDTGSF